MASEPGEMAAATGDIIEGGISEEITVDGQQLVDFLNSTQFKLQVNNIFGKTRGNRQEIEMGFTAFFDPTTSEWFIVYGTEAGINTLSVGKKGMEREDKQQQLGRIPVIQAHNHHLRRSQIFAYTPSAADMGSIQALGTRSSGNPIGLIMIDRGPGNSEFVIYQRTRNALNFDKQGVFDQYRRDVETNETTRDVFDLLENYGYKGANFSFPLTPAGAAKLKDFSASFKKPSI